MNQNQIREVMYNGSKEQFQALLEEEARLPRQPERRQGRRVVLTLYGPIGRGASLCWLVSNGANQVLNGHREGRGASAGAHGVTIYFRPEKTLEDIADEAARKGLELHQVLSVGQVCVSELPQCRLRVVFDLGKFRPPGIFWKWAEGLEGELGRLGFGQVERPAREQAELDLLVPGRYGTNRNLTAAEVRAIVAQCRAFVERGGKINHFWEDLNLDPDGKYFAERTLYSWYYDPKFNPDREKPKAIK